MWKVSVCVHDYGGTPKNMACRTRHGAGVRGSAQRPHVAPRPTRGGPQQPMVAAPACPQAPGRTGIAAVLRPACGQQGARPAARRGVGEASGSAGDSRVRGGAGGDATGNGTLYFLYSRKLNDPDWTWPVLATARIQHYNRPYRRSLPVSGLSEGAYREVGYQNAAAVRWHGAPIGARCSGHHRQ